MTEPGGSGRAGDGHAISPVELAGDPRHVEPDEVQLIVGVVGQRALGKLELLVPADLGRNPDYGPDDGGQRPVLQLGHQLPRQRPRTVGDTERGDEQDGAA